MFNTSTRKEDLSLKLRSQNLRNAKKQTKELAEESRRMEDRLQELKLAITREKEQREASGGGFWQTGQEGNLGNYAQEVLKKPAKKNSASSNREKSSKKSRVKVLKDEPILVPERNKAPGTMANIAQRNLSGNKEKIKGPKCGQCEQKAAHVSCQECGEDYCAGCFAAFHLKGALKKHRSVPLGSNGLRPTMSPRPITNREPMPAQNSARSARENMYEREKNRNNIYQNGDRSSPTGSSQGQGGSLLDGDYDEGANAEEFAQALAAWRSGKSEPDPAPRAQPRAKPRTVTPREYNCADSGTSTQEEKKPPIQINFKSSLTYAERLLLKRHRRTELGRSPSTTGPVVGDHSIPTVGVGSGLDQEEDEHVDFEDVVGLVTPRGGAMNPFAESAHGEPKPEPVYHTAGGMEGVEEEYPRSESSLSIIMVDNMPAHRLRKFEQSSTYDVTEGPDDTIFHIDKSRVTPDSGRTKYAFATPPTSGRPSPANGRRARMVSPISTALSQSKENKPEAFAADSSMTVISQNVLLKKAGQSTGSATTTPTPRSAKKERPQSRAKSRNAGRGDNRPGSRAKSRAESRPGSRAKSRTYMYGEGLLTKGPSESLKEVARLAGQTVAPDYQKADLSSFFTVGVKPMQPKERVMTPSGQRKKQPEGGIEKWRVSNKLYSMGPRSWRPDSSLGENVDNTQVMDYFADNSVAALEAASDEVMKAGLTPREPEGSTVSWSWSEHSGLGDRPASRTRQRTQQEKERTWMREQAFQQREDVFPAEPQPTSMGLQLQPVAGGRPSTPRATPTPRRTPRPNSRGTPRPDSGRPGSRSIGNRQYSNLHAIPGSAGSQPRPASSSGRESRAIVVDGDELTAFDDDRLDQNDDDHTLGQLEWELASQEGRVTADGKISRMSLMDDDLDIPEDNGPGCGLDSPTPDILETQLRESVLMDDFVEMEDQYMADEVKALE